MELPQGQHSLGPPDGEIRIRTGREGVAARVGHDLVIRFDRWSAHVRVGSGGPADVAVDVEIDVASFAVVSGSGGLNPLTDDDRADITRSALKVLDVDRHPTANFRSTAARPAPDGGVLEGMLTVAGRTGELRLQVAESGPGKWGANGSLKQSELGIKPFKAMLGALRLADTVEIEVEVHRIGD